jgi:hypothetical protein
MELYSVFFFLWHSGLNSGPAPWGTPPVLICEGFFFFWDRVLQTICLGWLYTEIFPISASWVARFIHMSHDAGTECPFEYC